jgi:hypothetical protein
MTLVVTRRRIVVQAMVQFGGSGREPSEKPKRGKHAGEEPANPHAFARPFRAHNHRNAAASPPVASLKPGDIVTFR